MKVYNKVLTKLLNNPDISHINSDSNIDVNIVKQLYEARLIDALDASEELGLCYQEPRVNIRGQEWIKNYNRTIKPEEDMIDLKPNFMGLVWI
jgi:hypothetical protein